MNGADSPAAGDTPPTAPMPALEARPRWLSLGQALSRRALHFER